MAIALALLMLPMLGSGASAEDATAAAPVQDAGVLEGPTAAAKDAASKQTVDAAAVPEVCDTNAGTGKVDTFMQNTAPDRSGEWANGNMNETKANLAEGQVVPQRVQLINLAAGENELVFTYDVYLMDKDVKKWAYDYIQNWSMTGGPSITEWTVKNDGGPKATVYVTFDVPAGSTSGTLYFDAHIASELDHGPGSGAGSINGSPYHVALVSLNCASSGAQDNQIMASAIDAGELTVIKEATPADGTDFHFSIEPGGTASTFYLDDDSDATLQDQVTYRVAPGSYTVGEIDIPAGWTLTGAACSKTPLGSTPTSRTVAVADDEKVSCTFTNSKTEYADLTVTKTATPSFDRDYDWTILKSVDQARQEIPEGSTATFDYSVVVTPSAPADTNFKVGGKISVANPNPVAFTGVNVTDSIPGATCSVTDGQNVTVPANSTVDLDYSCSLPSATASTTGTNTATVTWPAADYFGTDGSAEGSAAFDFAQAVKKVTDDSVTVSDSQYDLTEGGSVDTTVKASDGAQTFTYKMNRKGTAGECTTYPNTATITEKDGGTQTSSKSVEVCVGKDLSVSKVVVLKYDRAYSWSITKDVDATSREVDPATGKATFTYKVTAEAKSYADSKWAMSGRITVTNPNKWQDVTLSSIVDTTNVGGGAECTVDEGDDLVVSRNTSRVFDYACTFTSQPSYTGKNTATITWDKVVHATPSGSASGEAAVMADTEPSTSINKTVTVVDDKTNPSSPITLGTVTWSEGFKKEFTYSLELAGKPGTCVDYTNTAWIKETQQSASKTVKVCAATDLLVSKTAYASYDRVYLWDIDKVADKTRVEIAENGEATFNYIVKAIPDGYDDTGHEIHGAITVKNPNDFEAVTVNITDSIDLAGVSCTVTDGTKVVVPAKSEVTRSYTCVVPDVAASDYAKGVNTATVTWDGGSEIAKADVKFTLDDEIDKVVDVKDDKVTLGSKPELLGTADWTQGVKEFRYSLKQSGVIGKCTGYTNTATVDLSRGDIGVLASQWTIEAVNPTASETVTVCVEDGLEVSKTVQASFGRTYQWLIDKSVDQTRVEVSGDGSATFNYTVKATPNGSTDSGYAMSGTITVKNPNTYAEGAITAKVTDVPSVGGGAVCAVAGGDSVTIEPGQSKVLNFSCSFTGKPSDGTNVAKATWNGPDTKERTATSSAVPAKFVAGGHANSTVTVTDSMTSPSTLGTASWNVAGTPTVFRYSVTHRGVSGRCVDHTNTATIAQTGQSDSQTVTVCGQGGLVVTKSAEATYDRTFEWDITKVADRDRLDTEQGEPGMVNYTVGVTPDGYVDSGWEMTGAVTVLNPNAYKDVRIELTDVPDLGEGASCVFDENADFLVEAGETRTFTYTCSFEQQPAYDGSNTVIVDWGAGKVSTTTDVEFELDEATDETVTVTDDMVEPSELGTVTWDEDGQTVEFEYALEHEGRPDVCETVTNTATIVETGQSAQADVLVCGAEILPAEEEVPPKPRPPAILPETGAQAGLGLWTTLGGLMVALGVALLALRRRNAS